MSSKSVYLIRIGIVCIIAAMMLTGFNMIQSNKAAKAGNSLYDTLSSMIQITDELDINADREMAVQMLDGVEYIGTIEIEQLGVHLPVAAEVTKRNLHNSPCRYIGSAYADNMVVAAHNYSSHFGNIKKLVPGDTVVFDDMEGHRFQYEVVSTEVLKGTDVEQMADGDWDMTLFTCTLDGQKRITVRCERLI